jgi:hypothetical protein
MYFLIEHNRTSKETHWTEFSDYSAAQFAVLQKEQKYFHDMRHEMEVVVFESNSIDDLKRTHSRYFVKEGQKDNAADALLAIGLIGLAVYLLNKK